MARDLRVPFFSVLLFSAALSFTSDLLAEDARPNIIYIMSDDMGYSDIGCYGSEIETPNLDGLASNGLRFTQFYNMARCCPTRACLLTGLYPHQAGIGHMIGDSGYDGYRGELNKHCVTLAEVLKSAGYRTYMSGKWHVTGAVHPKTEDEKFNWPLQRGFDRFYGTIHGAGSFFDPKSLSRDNLPIAPETDDEYQPKDGFYYTDAIADNAITYVNDHEKQHGDSPFFMYVSFTAAHWPMHARERDIEKYKGKYDAGYQAIRDQRYKRMLELGVIDRESTTNGEIDPAWMESEHLDWDIRNMEVYAAMIDSMDQGIGRLIKALEANGQLDNTLLLFFQDNGGCAENYGRGGVGKQRASEPTLDPLPRGYLQTDMQPKQTRDGYPVRTGKGVMAGPADTYIGYGRGWATVSNTPFREYKHWVHEGGISTPLIAHWPKGFDRKGELVSTPSHLVDLMATAVDLGQANYPSERNGEKIYPMEGVSLVPAFQGEDVEREAIFWEHEGNRAVRVGDMKLVAKGREGAWELYDISKDRSEQNDLSEMYPAKVKALSEVFNAYAERAHVLPLTPYRKPKQKFSKAKTKFSLKQGDDLDRNSGPFVQKRGIEFTATISEVTDGVLAAQGGVTHGWAVYLQDGKLCFAITNKGTRSTVSGTEPVKAGSLSVLLRKSGKVVMKLGGEPYATGNVPTLVTSQPEDGLQIGRDLKGNVGNYSTPFEYRGQISDCVLKITK